MRRLLPVLLLLVLAAPAQAGVRTLGGHNEIAVDGVGYFDVRIERDTTLFRANRQEGIHVVWKIRSSRADIFQALRLRRYGGGGGASADGSGTNFGMNSGPLPAGDYRFYVASPDGPATITIDIEGFEGSRVFAADTAVMGGGGLVPKIAELEDGTDVYGRSVYLDTPGLLFLQMAVGNDGSALTERMGGCQPTGREAEPVVDDFGPGCPEPGHYSSRNQVGHTTVDIPAGWTGYGGWVQGILGEPARRESRAIWLAEGPPMIAPVWPADAAPADAAPADGAPAGAPTSAATPPKAKPKAKAKKTKRTRKAKKHRAARKRQSAARQGRG